MKYSQLIFDDPKFKSAFPHLRRDQIISKLKESFYFENAHLRSSSNNEDQGVYLGHHILDYSRHETTKYVKETGSAIILSALTSLAGYTSLNIDTTPEYYPSLTSWK